MAGYGRFSPSKCCCESCTILSDGFNRDNSSNLGPNWSQEAGTFSLSGFQIVTTTANARLLHVTPLDVTDFQISGKVVSDIGGDQFRIFFYYTDPDNYHYAEWKSGTSLASVKIVKRVGGTETTLATRSVSRPTTTLYSINLCVSGTVAYFSVDAFSTSAIQATVTPIAPARVGLGTGATVVGTFTFDTFLVSEVSEDCEECTALCTGCLDGKAPAQFQVELVGVQPPAGTPTCDCLDANGVYLLDFDPTGAGTGDCVWGIQLGFGPCTTSIEIHINPSGSVGVQVLWSNLAASLYSQATSHPDCMNFDNFSIPFLVTTSGTAPCKLTGSSFKITTVS